jgi:hypothetical protein
MKLTPRKTVISSRPQIEDLHALRYRLIGLHKGLETSPSYGWAWGMDIKDNPRAKYAARISYGQFGYWDIPDELEEYESPVQLINGQFHLPEGLKGHSGDPILPPGTYTTEQIYQACSHYVPPPPDEYEE